MQKLYSNYTFDKVLGIGINGIVCKFISKLGLAPIAVKISTSENECYLIRKFKHIFDDPESKDLFGKVYKCFDSNNEDFDKKAILDKVDPEVKYKAEYILGQKNLVFIQSEYLEGRTVYYRFYNEPNVTKEDVYSILFELKYAIDWAMKKYNFTHNDLHVNNVMIVDNKVPRYYKVGDKSYKITSIYQPKIIDYDMAKLDLKYNNDYMNFSGALVVLEATIFGQDRFYFDWGKLMEDSFIVDRFEFTEPSKRLKCYICENTARYVLDTYKFCSDACLLKFHI